MSIKEQVTIDEAIELLNSAIKADQDAMHYLVEQRVRCNIDMAEHITIQVYKPPGGDVYTVGLLGILNGLFGIDDKGWGAIAAVFDVDCPKGHKTSKTAKVGDRCPECDSELVLGKLIKFVRRDK